MSSSKCDSRPDDEKTPGEKISRKRKQKKAADEPARKKARYETKQIAKEIPEEQTIPTEKTEKREEARAVTVCISSRSLFNLEEEFKIFIDKGPDEYNKAMVKREDKPFGKGAAFPFIQGLFAVNDRLLELNPEEKPLFDVVLMSHNNAHAGVAVLKSIDHYRLPMKKICFTSGNSVISYLKAFKTDLFLSADTDSVAEAFNEGIASASISPSSKTGSTSEQLRVAFDADAVSFESGPEKTDKPLKESSMKRFAAILGEIKKKFSADNCPIRTYLLTVRKAGKTSKQVLLTLKKWGLDIDETLFLTRASMGPILEKIQPHIFFDDQEKNTENSHQHSFPGALVPTKTGQ